MVATSAFPLELLAIVAGLRLAQDLAGRRKIIRGCESALKLINSPEKLNYWSNKANVALVKAAIALGGAESLVEHAHSHPESRLHKTRWSRNDKGNFIADRVATGDYASLFEYNQLEIVETTTFDIITELASIQTWFIASDEGVINLSPLIELAQANEAKLYMKERDIWHHKRLGRTDTPIDSFWSDRTLQHAATIWELEKADAKCTARAQRIILTSTGTHGIKPKGTQRLTLHANSVEKRIHSNTCLLSVNTPTARRSGMNVWPQSGMT